MVLPGLFRLHSHRHLTDRWFGLRCDCRGAFSVAQWGRICLQCKRCRRCGFDAWVGKMPWKRVATHSRIRAWKISWTEKPGGLQSTGLQRGHDWARTHAHTWLTGQAAGGNLDGYRPGSSSLKHKGSDVGTDLYVQEAVKRPVWWSKINKEESAGVDIQQLGSNGSYRVCVSG